MDPDPSLTINHGEWKGLRHKLSLISTSSRSEDLIGYMYFCVWKVGWLMEEWTDNADSRVAFGRKIDDSFDDYQKSYWHIYDVFVLYWSVALVAILGNNAFNDAWSKYRETQEELLKGQAQ